MSSPSPPNPTTTTNAAPTKSTAITTTVDYPHPSVVPQGARKHLHPVIYQSLYNPQPTTTPLFPPPSSQRQHRPHHQQPPPGAVLYPVASSGRGFIPKHHHDQNLIPNSVYPYPLHRPYGQNSHQTLMGGGAVMPAGATGVSVSTNPKVAGQSSFADDKSLKNARDKNGDDTFVMIRDRKVQISEGTSLYAQCRSWLKNGYTLENQPQYVDCMKSLPKPLPASMVEASKETDTEMEEKTEDVENMYSKELLQQHVKHAKKVRVRLRNQRLQRIERYKDRLALLLPPIVDQQPKNDPAS